RLMNATSTTASVGDQSAGAQIKTIVSFDTSSLPDDATVVGATLRLNRVSLVGTNPFTVLGSALIDVRTGGFGGNTALQTSDFQAAATAAASGTMSNPATNGSWSTGALNAAGQAAINKPGTTQLRVAFSTPSNGTSSADRMQFASGDNANTSLWPELVVSYLPAAPPTTTTVPTTSSTSTSTSSTTSTTSADTTTST